jgi:geranylgeranyl diphosphate synthase, type II
MVSPAHTRPSEISPADLVGSLRQMVEDALPGTLTNTSPKELYDPVRYVLASEGKRLRPILVLLAANLRGGRVEHALPAALATEVFHVFTLVHDDIMDRSATRRGRETVHVKWDESTAILAGDYLLGLSFDLLTQTAHTDLRQLLEVFHRTVRLLCEGQALDKAFEARTDVSLDEYMAMIDRKTAALLSCGLEMGGVIAGVDPDGRRALREAGHHLGCAFQVHDDLLDLVAHDESWGKPVGGDLIEAKKAYLLLTALSMARGEEHAFFERIARNGASAEDVQHARVIMERLGVLERARQTVAYHTGKSLECLRVFPESPGREGLEWIIERMRSRSH